MGELLSLSGEAAVAFAAPAHRTQGRNNQERTGQAVTPTIMTTNFAAAIAEGVADPKDWVGLGGVVDKGSSVLLWLTGPVAGVRVREAME